MIHKSNLQFRSTPPKLNLKEVKYIIIHHIAKEQATAEDIHKWHLARTTFNGTRWRGAGYGYYIRKNGETIEMRGLREGAHTHGYNNISIGIALEGNYDIEEYVPDEQVLALQELVKDLKRKLNRSVNVVGHGYVHVTTSCPGKHFDVTEVMHRQFREQHYAEGAWEYCNEHALRIHEKRFDEPITRGELITLLARLKGWEG